MKRTITAVAAIACLGPLLVAAFRGNNLFKAPLACFRGKRTEGVVVEKHRNYFASSFPWCLMVQVPDCGNRTANLGCQRVFASYDPGDHIALKHLDCQVFVPAFSYTVDFFSFGRFHIPACLAHAFAGTVLPVVIVLGVLVALGAIFGKTTMRRTPHD